MVTTERVTVTLPSEMLAGIDRIERNRSRFIAEAVRNELDRRRREELLVSLQNPHPSSDELLALGTADWLPDVADDAGLLDPDAGTPVTWTAGNGWLAGSR